ncbi:hypothetical protein PVK06_007946 [Gossypium arboreum]|uniref:Uncharacterized protein n=1 Tax=Gossypium arboreum TaxID=29729 RepID=A0ABR0QIN6_GOSAR|nr:hypothetical protein PVK06_007946 [Gossypium arboreum]
MTPSFSGWQSTCNFGSFNNYTRRDDVFPVTSTSKGTSNPRDIGGVENKEGTKFDANLILEPKADGLKIVLFSEPKSVPTKLEDEGSNGKGPSEDAEKDSLFRAYSSPIYMHNVDLSVEYGLEFVEFPHRRPSHASISWDHLKLDLEMIENIILLMVKESLKITVPVFIVNICSQFDYTPSYCKAWIVNKNALENMHNGWDISYNDLW